MSDTKLVDQHELIKAASEAGDSREMLKLIQQFEVDNFSDGVMGAAGFAEELSEALFFTISSENTPFGLKACLVRSIMLVAHYFRNVEMEGCGDPECESCKVTAKDEGMKAPTQPASNSIH